MRKLKCFFLGHQLADWFMYKSTKEEETYCTRCLRVFRREPLPLPVQIEHILEMDISREEVKRKLDNLTELWGYRKFTTALMLLARQKFKVKNREARYETRERLVTYYLRRRTILTTTHHYATMAISKIIKHSKQ